MAGAGKSFAGTPIHSDATLSAEQEGCEDRGAKRNTGTEGKPKLREGKSQEKGQSQGCVHLARAGEGSYLLPTFGGMGEGARPPTKNPFL